jgi:DNA-binding MarR family transcriptional regulator
MDDRGLPPALADKAGFLIAKTHALFHTEADRLLGHGPLGIKAFACLTVIEDEGPLSQQLLGARMRIDRTTIVAVVDALEEAGLVERARDPGDRRAYALQITADGRRWLRGATRKVRDGQERLLAPLTAPEREQLIALLQKLLVSEPAELVADAPVEVRAG